VAGVDSSKKLVDLSGPEQASLCDWVAQQLGGYGSREACDGGGHTPSSTPTQSDCVSSIADIGRLDPACPATLGQVSSCLQAQLAACNDETPSPDCATLQACEGPHPGGDAGPFTIPGCSVSSSASGAAPASADAGCSVGTTWSGCSDGNAYEVDCSCPDAICVCKRNGTPTGTTLAFACPAACMGPGPSFQACGFP
jgi:hypothetical protein